MLVSFDFVGGALCLDFVNAINSLFSRDCQDDEDPYQRLLRWVAERGEPALPARDTLLRIARKNPGECRGVLRRARVLAGALRDILESTGQGKEPPSRSLRAFHQELHRLGRQARLEPGPPGASWEWRDPRERLDSPLAPIVRSATDLLLSGKASEIKICAADSCRWLFLDESRNRKRKWCDMKICGNRTKVRRYRARYP